MKTKRYEKILELITKYDIETQDELVEKLVEEGYNVTQATISRDIRKLNLMKASNGMGKQRYVKFSQQDTVFNPELFEKYVRILRDGLVDVQEANSIIVVHTVSGMAMAVAAAIDSLKIHGIVGCIAGDDTIFCAVAIGCELQDIIEKIEAYITEE